MKWTRRDVIKSLGGLPILGTVWWAGASAGLITNKKRSEILEQLNIQASLPPVLPPIEGNPIRVGIIGFGIRGEQLCRSLGFATKEWLQEMEEAVKADPNRTDLKDFMNQAIILNLILSLWIYRLA